jgi:hypothetical protein
MCLHFSGNPLKRFGACKFHICFDKTKLCFLLSGYIYDFRLSVRINSNFIPEQPEPVDFFNGEAVCFLRGRN